MILFFIFIFGLTIGSFINCFIWRLYKGESLLNRSYCPKCRKKISWYDNIPIFSFLFLGGKCRHCQKKISLQYPVVEFIVGILFMLFWWKYTGYINSFELYQTITIDYLKVFKGFFIISVMVVIFIYDLKWYLILDKISLPASLVMLIINLFSGVALMDILICAIVGSSFFLIQFLVSNGRWIGGGDIRLGLLMGLIFPQLGLLILAIMLGYFIGSIIGIGLMFFGKKKWGSQLPLGVFLSTSTIITIIYGQEILDWYLGIVML